VSEPAKTRTRGAPLKANKLEARIAFRASQELVDWLKEEGRAREIDAGTMARLLLVELKQAKQQKE